MYRNAYQRGMLTVFFSVGSKPLNIWETHTEDGYITRFLDQDIKSMVVEIGGTNVSTTYMTCPKGNNVLGITMPFLVMIVKNLKKYFSFEVTILDETGTRRRFRVSNFQSTTQILPLCTVMPIGLSEGWNQIQFNLAEFTRRAYKKQFVEVQKLKINANIRLRRIYFAERLIPEDQLPPEYKLYFPLASKGPKDKKAVKGDKENIEPSTSQPTPAGAVEEKKTSKDDLKPGSKTSVHSIKAPSGEQKTTPEEVLAEVVAEAVPESAAEPATETEAPTETTATEPKEGAEEAELVSETQAASAAEGTLEAEAAPEADAGPEVEATPAAEADAPSATKAAPEAKVEETPAE